MRKNTGYSELWVHSERLWNLRYLCSSSALTSLARGTAGWRVGRVILQLHRKLSLGTANLYLFVLQAILHATLCW
jgi:hypothetical protein